jgi:hypothetical protein
VVGKASEYERDAERNRQQAVGLDQQITLHNT